MHSVLTHYMSINLIYWENKLKEEAYTKSTLKYLNIDNMEMRKTHMVWEAAGYETMSVSKAMIKVKLLLGTYILQSNRHKFNKYEVRPDCPLCNSGDEDRKHFIVICSKLMDVRQKFIIALKNILYIFGKNPASTLRIHNVAVWLLFGQVPFLRENYVATTYFRYVICKSL